jgi:nitroreductase
MDCLSALKTRRSVRAYTNEPVARELLEELVDCGRLAATARNDQPWEFVVVTKPAELAAIAAATDHGRFVAHASACILVFCHDGKYYLEDGSAASQNILVAAHAAGLGACWVAGDKKAYAETLRQMVGAPADCRLVSLLSIGHPAESPKPAKRPLSDVLHWDRY